mgnify:CR=1 FL=1
MPNLASAQWEYKKTDIEKVEPSPGSFVVTPGTGTFRTSESGGSYTVTPGTGSFVTRPQDGSFAVTPGSGTWAGRPQDGSFVVTPGSGTWTTSPIGTLTVAISSAPPLTISLDRATTNFTYIATGNGSTIDVSTRPTRAYAIQVVGTGAAATTWDIRLEGSLNNSNFSQILQHTNTTGDGAVLWSGSTLSPSLYIRSRTAGLTLGSATNVVVTILGTP